ncbi:MAG: PEP-CTERM sorting domain-containing protein [Verrucomicrobiota bacterium]
MKRIIALAVLLGLVGSASAATIAHWNFEEGATGVGDTGIHAGDWDNHYQDISGNGNHMSTWPIEGGPNRPTYTADVPYNPVPQTGAPNGLALDFAGGKDISTFGAHTGPKMVESYMFNTWTVEATFKLRDLYWEVIVGKDGQRGDLGGAVGAEAPFWLKLLDFNKHLEVLAIDDNDNFHVAATQAPILANEWYSVAARFDGTAIDLWLKGPGDTEYQFQNCSDFFGPDVGGVGCSLGGFSGAGVMNGGSWSIGRGAWNGGAVDFINGVVDEVRISDGALAPSEFMAVPEPATLGLFGLIGGGMLWVRKRFMI